MKHILIPTDFSDNAWNALVYGISFFKKTHCTFHIVHINAINTNSSGEAAMYVSPDLLEKTILAESREKLKVLIKKVEKLPLNTKHYFKTQAIYGFLTDQLKDQVKEKNIELIIMGTKGSSGLKAVSIGSNTGNVITKVPCTIMAVPESATYESVKEIGFPSDLNLAYEIKVLDTIKDIILLKNSALRLLYISSKGEELNTNQIKIKNLLLDYFKETECTFHEVTGKKIDESVQCFTESRNLDMLIMVAKNLNFLESILFRPTVERISYHTKVPFLVIHE
ncbi:universal stress protein [Maribacter stanieri]|jgi:nucleotide-binding universal stress UspA family protein|uniref:Nucleotide-binding universal stress protein, UspA family n=1 Tax=Maribacter stanieri TaxID=440514 RepID=A0A1I6JFJ4_9FLAO|nr:universal stress protein [Maribacter stanieri]SFR77747.1 Nucleotide-binding universal stress protein, UspA family [Maribacter stanieri]